MKTNPASFPLISCFASHSTDAVRHDLRLNGFTFFELNGQAVHDKASFISEVKRVLPLDPALVAGSWPAFEDSLWEGLNNLDAPKVAILWHNCDKMLAHGLVTLLFAVDCFTSVSRSLASVKSGAAKRLDLLIVLFGEGENFPKWDK